MKLVRLSDTLLSEDIRRRIQETSELELHRAHRWIHEGSGEGANYLGWVHQPAHVPKDLISSILKTAKSMQDETQVMIVIGIGGSYLGSRAAIQMLLPTFQNNIYFAGHQMSAGYLKDLVREIGQAKVCLNVISKSGTTLESALTFRFFRDFMINRYGCEVANKIIVTTDAKKGALYDLAQREGYPTFVIPDNIGGRFSVLTPVGLLPMAYAGIDIESVLEGAAWAYDDCQEMDLQKNDAYHYALARNILLNEGKKIEVMVQYEPKLYYFTEWWKQLFGESEGKEGKGLFPANLSFSTDLHSMGQYLQQGPRHMFETILWVDETDVDWPITGLGDETDGLSYLEGKGLNYVNRKAMEATALAHTTGGVPNLLIQVSHLDARTFGYAVYFFMIACAMSAYLLGVNPFDQPGVEAYKQNMYKLLGKHD